MFVRGLLGVRRTPVAVPSVDAPGEVVAFMPARDEASVIEESVRSVLAQRQVARLVVVDDGSTDGTTQKLATLALEHRRLTVIRGEAPKPGECGKPAALASAYERDGASREWLLFVDADVVLAEGAVGGLLALSADRDLVSVIPQVNLRTLAEHAVMPSVGSLVLAENPPHLVADPRSKKAFANGQVILIRRSAYDAAGGHRAVVAEVLEDVRLAQRVKAGGGRLCIADGRRIARTRMYESWSELAEGWTKNLYLLLGASPARTLWWVTMALGLGWIGPAMAILFGWPYGVAAYAAIFAMQATLRARGGAPWIGALLAPLGALGASYLALESMRRRLSSTPVRWKGRSY